MSQEPSADITLHKTMIASGDMVQQALQEVLGGQQKSADASEESNHNELVLHPYSEEEIEEDFTLDGTHEDVGQELAEALSTVITEQAIDDDTEDASEMPVNWGSESETEQIELDDSTVGEGTSEEPYSAFEPVIEASQEVHTQSNLDEADSFLEDVHTEPDEDPFMGASETEQNWPVFPVFEEENTDTINNGYEQEPAHLQQVEYLDAESADPLTINAQGWNRLLVEIQAETQRVGKTREKIAELIQLTSQMLQSFPAN